MTISHLTTASGRTLAYSRLPGRSPGVVLLGGLRSSMTGSLKATALEAFCRERGQAFLSFDYSGHGASGGAFEEGTIGRWADDARAVIEAVTEGPQLLVGSSMGGWIGLLLARTLPERVAGLVGIAAAPDFTEDLMWAALSEEQRRQIETRGILHVPSAYTPDEPTAITRALIEDGRRHLLLRVPLALNMPVRLLHGMADPDVPWQTGLRLMETLSSGNAQITLVKDGDHRLARPDDLALICRTVGTLLDALG